MRGIKRVHGTAQAQARPLLPDDLNAVFATMGSTLKDDRDRALLLIGFAGGPRRSELVSINHADIEPSRRGIIITFGDPRPTSTVRAGLSTSHSGSIVAVRWPRSIDGSPVGHYQRSNLPPRRSPRQRARRTAVRRVRVARPEGAGCCCWARLARKFWGHSLRAGFVTAAALFGMASWQIRRQTGHSSDAILARYIRVDAPVAGPDFSPTTGFIF